MNRVAVCVLDNKEWCRYVVHIPCFNGNDKIVSIVRLCVACDCECKHADMKPMGEIKEEELV